MVLHMMVEELLQLLVDKVDGDLLEAVIFKDLEASDVEHSAEVGLRQSLQTFKVISAFFLPTTDLLTWSIKVSLHLPILGGTKTLN